MQANSTLTGNSGGVRSVVYLQDKGVMRAGLFQLIVDLTILIVALFMLPLKLVALSIIGAFVLNLTVAINHKPGRYRGMS